jgi:hypothetical protein
MWLPLAEWRSDHRARIDLAAVNPDRTAEAGVDVERGLDNGLVVTWLPKVTLRKAFYLNVLSVYASRKMLKSLQTQLLQTRES